MVTLQLINENLSSLKKSSLFDSVRNWANERGLIQEGDVKTQTLKLFEELGELSRSVIKSDLKEKKDAIGDSIVVCINLLCIKSINAEDLISKIQPAYNEEIDKEVLNMDEKSVALDCYNVIAMSTEFEAIFNSLLCCLSHIAILNETTLVECLELAYNQIKNRTGKMLNGSFIKNE